VRRRRGTARELTQRDYGEELGEELLSAAEMTMRAHLQKLVDDGQVRISTGSGEDVFEPA
jgi:predicted ArsR family transcriptional regulator